MQHSHICGLHFSEGRKRIYLPQVELKSHTTITPVCFTTSLTQRFENPNDTSLSQVRYTFPLYEGVAVNSYIISYADKTIRGIVQQKDQAKATFKAAAERGEAAGLLESLPAGVFGVTLSNIPAKTAISVDITYCGELKHDAAIDGLRYTLPTSIAPRYGSYPGEVLKSNVSSSTGIGITVDIDMVASAIRKVQSPSHPIAVSMGALSTTEGGEKAPFAASQASATLTRGSSELADDFILQLLVDDISRPQAIVEHHPDIPDHRAVMTTLVPKFALEPGHPEIIFIADQSGSMSGTKNAALLKALKVFLKSLPLGVRFNICAFGSDFKFLFPTSQAYSEDSVTGALNFVETFEAQYGGTEILKPIKAAFEQHLSDLPLEVMLLTDGEIWDEKSVFDFINDQIRETKVDARVFAMGIGRDVSHTLVEGVARAGNGFAQFVTQDEDTDQKVVRMLKGALYAHTKDYEIEVHYGDEDERKMSDGEDFEIVEKVNDCLKIADRPAATAQQVKADGSGGSKPLSIFDPSVDLDTPTKTNESADRYAHLPVIRIPKLLQAPSLIPPLFPFNRTTLYLLLGPETPQKTIASVTLRASSPQGPLQLDVPVHSVGVTAVPTIHQLAARKAIQDLEEGRGWLQSASVDGTPIKTNFQSRFDELVERECVRLGEKFQVTGKWTSFVAFEANAQGDKRVAQEQVEEERLSKASLFQRPAATSAVRGGNKGAFGSGSGALFGAPSGPVGAWAHRSAPDFGAVSQNARPSGGLFGASAPRGLGATTTNASQNVAPWHASPAPTSAFSAFSATAAFNPATASPSYSPVSPAEELDLEDSDDEEMGYGLFDDESDGAPARFLKAEAEEDSDADVPEMQVDPAALEKYQREMQDAAAMPLTYKGDSLDLSEDGAPASAAELSAPARSSVLGKKRAAVASPLPAATTSARSARDVSEIMTALIDLQTFSGAWGWNAELLDLLSVSEADVKSVLGGEGGAGDETVLATALAMAFLEKMVSAKKEVWEMVAAKARVYLGHVVGDRMVEDLIGKAAGLF